VERLKGVHGRQRLPRLLSKPEVHRGFFCERWLKGAHRASTRLAAPCPDAARALQRQAPPRLRPPSPRQARLAGF
jgi:hypothetical protein